MIYVFAREHVPALRRHIEAITEERDSAEDKIEAFHVAMLTEPDDTELGKQIRAVFTDATSKEEVSRSLQQLRGIVEERDRLREDAELGRLVRQMGDNTALWHVDDGWYLVDVEGGEEGTEATWVGATLVGVGMSMDGPEAALGMEEEDGGE